MGHFQYLKILNSPFKNFTLKFYLGKITQGCPYFLPRKWRKLTNTEAIEAATKDFNNPKLIKKSFGHWYGIYKRSQRAIPIKWFGFNYTSLGWKTKWEDTDYRYEYGIMYSLVFCHLQFCIYIAVPHPSNYWESWLYYTRDTNKTLSKKERIEQCKKEFPQLYTSWNKENEKITTDYYPLILKKKYV